MKKLIVILSIFILLMAGAVGEIVYTSAFYSKTHDLLTVLEDSMVVHPDELNNPETLRKLEDVENHWKKGKKIALMLGNHTVVRNADERMVALSEYLRLNEKSDALVSLRQAESYIHDLITDNYPNITNLI